MFTIHRNTITSMRPYQGQRGAITKVSATGVDGKLVVWNVGAVTAVASKPGNIHLTPITPSMNSLHRTWKKYNHNRDRDSLLLSAIPSGIFQLDQTLGLVPEWTMHVQAYIM